MNLFAANIAALFVPRDSLLSQVELLARDVKPGCGQTTDDQSRDTLVTKTILETRLRCMERLQKVSGEPKSVPIEIPVHSNASQQHDTNLRRVLVKSQGELESQLKVCFLVAIIVLSVDVPSIG